MSGIDNLQQYLLATKAAAVAQRNLHELDLENLLVNTTGIGEHVHISKDVLDLVDLIEKQRSRIDAIDALLKDSADGSIVD